MFFFVVVVLLKNIKWPEQILNRGQMPRCAFILRNYISRSTKVDIKLWESN